MSEAIQGFMTEKEFLAQIKICRATLNKFKNKKLITHFKVGRRILYNADSRAKCNRL